jgi:hypothetical protein
MYKVVLVALTVLSLSAPAFAAKAVCNSISKQVENEEVFFSPPATHEVIGDERLYFYTAPNDNCRSKDVFVIPGDTLITYTEFKGWYSVMYINPKTGKDYDGWVRSERLKRTGTIRPKY